MACHHHIFFFLLVQTSRKGERKISENLTTWTANVTKPLSALLLLLLLLLLSALISLSPTRETLPLPLHSFFILSSLAIPSQYLSSIKPAKSFSIFTRLLYRRNLFPRSLASCPCIYQLLLSWDKPNKKGKLPLFAERIWDTQQKRSTEQKHFYRRKSCVCRQMWLTKLGCFVSTDLCATAADSLWERRKIKRKSPTKQKSKSFSLFFSSSPFPLGIVFIHGYSDSQENVCCWLCRKKGTGWVWYFRFVCGNMKADDKCAYNFEGKCNAILWTRCLCLKEREKNEMMPEEIHPLTKSSCVSFVYDEQSVKFSPFCLAVFQ